MVDQMLMDTEQDDFIEDPKDLTGVQKAAVFLISFGVEKASKILKELKDAEVEKITKAISEMKNISPPVVDSVMEQFYELMTDRQFLVEGGQDIAKNLLEQTKGKNQADEMFRKFEAERGEDAFSIIQNSEVENIVHFLKNEHPQIAAVILAHLKLNKSAEILTHLPDDFRSDVALRMARLGKISNDVVEE
ncbi:MAG TPA: hypothetical protein VKM36_02015, partial [Balneolaceae bacterium]|nr:hypothetical protein [Balneolaceae bacterium]